ncbi:P-loop NTPase fold protein [Pseudomonas sp. Ps21-P2]|uniref:P-loop NTPase fold protein n=1 Tax=Pseudomonas sp. Ps21-P2 TaxID=3080331 RepID=UPI003207B10B
MQRISFQNEQPSELDVFPGGSHNKVASAICSYVSDDQNSKVIGLDGEFGSGKSSILKMVEQKLLKLDSKYRVWFFDCEQNYQGSIKSNFIELFTEELVANAGTDEKTKAALRESRDKALGRHFTYTKNTISRVSGWALLLIVALFFSSSSFKELFALTKQQGAVPKWIYALHIASLLSPALTLIGAWWRLKGTKVGNQPWSIFYLFKGGSDDTITEKIQVAKEVTPLDLKRTLEADLKLFKDTHYIIILDNLDRLPKDSLRSVWSDLEIFTWASEENNLTTIVPFCSSKVAKYLGADKDRTYDSKDFIAKKFPVVFRAPPIITAGWKDGFYKLWESTYPEANREIAEKCALLLQRHSPMANKLVTPRLQKRFINDIATTALTLGVEIDFIAIAAHLLLCKYNDHPIQEILRTDGFSEAYVKEHPDVNEPDIAATKQFLGSAIGSDVDDGWQIQFLQIHFLTTNDIAIAELIDEPLSLAIQDQNGERFAALVSTFGFKDALKRFVSKDGYRANLIRTLHDAEMLLDATQMSLVISTVNSESSVFTGEIDDEEEFYDALKSCRLAGLSTAGFGGMKTALEMDFKKAISENVIAEDLDLLRDKLQQYDRFLDALGAEFAKVTTSNAAYFIHVVAESEDLNIITPEHFTFNKQGNESVLQHLVSTPETPAPLIALSEEQREFLLTFMYSSSKAGLDPIAQLTDAEMAVMPRVVISTPLSNGTLYALALQRKLDDPTLANLATLPFEGLTESQNAAVAAIFLNAGNFTAFSKVAGLDSVVDTDLFKLFFRAAGDSESLKKGLADENTSRVIAKILAWAVQASAINRLDFRYFTDRFETISTSIEEYGVTAQQLFSWLHDWERFMAIKFEPADAMDADFIRRITQSSDELYPVAKSTALEYYGSAERTEPEWVGILRSTSPNHAMFINMFKTKEGFGLAATARSAIVNILKQKVSSQDDLIDQNVVDNIQTVISTFDQGQKNLLGTDIRTLIYSADTISGQVAWVLEIFGELVVDIQPSSTLEVGKLMGILDFLSEGSEDALPVLQYLDSRADQISAYHYSQELRKAMAVAVAKLNKTAPRLFQAFAKKNGFKGLIRDLMRSDRKPPVADLESDRLEPTDSPES